MCFCMHVAVLVYKLTDFNEFLGLWALGVSARTGLGLGAALGVAKIPTDVLGCAEPAPRALGKITGVKIH